MLLKYIFLFGTEKGKSQSKTHLISNKVLYHNSDISQWQLTGVPVMAHLASGLGGIGLGSETKPPWWEVF